MELNAIQSNGVLSLSINYPPFVLKIIIRSYFIKISECVNKRSTAGEFYYIMNHFRKINFCRTHLFCHSRDIMFTILLFLI